MNNVVKNILLFVMVLVLSYFTAEYLGSWYDKFSPQSDDSWFSFSKQQLILLVGGPFTYIFFTTLLFQSFGFGNRNKWTLWFLAPALLFFASGDLKHIYLPIILALIAFGLATLIRKIFKYEIINTEPSPR